MRQKEEPEASAIPGNSDRFRLIDEMMYKKILYTFLIAWAGFGLSYAGNDIVPKGGEATPGALSVANQRKFDYFYYEGLNMKAVGQYDAALDLFNHCLTIDSTASAVLFELSSFYLQLNRPEKAVNVLQRAVRHSPENFTYRMTLASVSRSLGMFGEAAEELEKLVKEYPNKIDLNFYLADALTQQGEIGKAIESYDALESAIGMSEPLSMQKYRLYVEIDEKENAFNEIKKLADKFPMQSRYQLLMGDLYLESGEPDKAVVCYQEAHRIEPEDPYYIVSMANYYEATGDKEGAEKEIRNALVNEDLDIETKIRILSRYIIRMQQSEQGIEGALSLFETLLEQHPEDTDLKMMYGSLLMSQERLEEAKFQFGLVTEMTPEDSGAWQQLLSISLQEQDIDELVRICEKCNELFPESPEFYFYLGIGFYQQEKYQKAIDAYKAGIEIIPADNRALKSDFYGQIGDTYYQLKDLGNTFSAYDEALKYNERNVPVLNNYSYFLSLDKKELKKAERMSAITIRTEPDNSTYLDTYAWILFVQGEYSLAKIYIERAISNDKTESTELVDHYGDILYMNGEKEKAVEQWLKAKEMGKESSVLDRKIKEKKYIEDANAQ